MILFKEQEEAELLVLENVTNTKLDLNILWWKSVYLIIVYVMYAKSLASYWKISL